MTGTAAVQRLAMLICLYKHMCGSVRAQDQIRTYIEYMKNEENTYAHLLYRIQAEKDYSTCLIVGNGRGMLQQQFLERMLQQQLLKPLLIYDADSVHTNALTFNREMLIIVYLEKLDIRQVLQNLAANLRQMARARILFIWTSAFSAATKTLAVDTLFRECQRLKLLNSIALLQDFAVSRSYYSYTQFPQFQIEQRNLLSTPKCRIFAARLRNLYGHGIRTSYQALSRQGALMLNMNSEVLMTPAATKILSLLAQKLNATLRRSYEVREGATLFRQDFLQLILNGTVDIPNALSRLASTQVPAVFAHPVMMARRCAVLLRPATAAYAEFFTTFLNPVRQTQVAALGFLHTTAHLINRKWLSSSRGRRLPIRIIDFLLNTHVMPAHLGLPYSMPIILNPTQRILCFHMSLLGVLYSTAIMVRMQVFLNAPPAAAAPLTWDTLQRANMKIVLTHREYDFLLKDIGDELQRYQSTLMLVNSMQEFKPFQHVADYAYPLTTTTFAKSQIYRKLLHPTSICVQPFMPLSFSLAKDSIYAEPLSELIMRAHEMGLLQHWIVMSVVRLRASGWLKQNPADALTAPRVLTMNDFRYLWTFVCALLTLSVLVCIWEWLYYYRIRRYALGRRMLKRWLVIA